MVQLLAGIISRGPNPGRSHGSADTLPLRHSANFIIRIAYLIGVSQDSSQCYCFRIIKQLEMGLSYHISTDNHSLWDLFVSVGVHQIQHLINKTTAMHDHGSIPYVGVAPAQFAVVVQ